MFKCTWKAHPGNREAVPALAVDYNQSALLGNFVSPVSKTTAVSLEDIILLLFSIIESHCLISGKNMWGKDKTIEHEVC